MCRGIIADGTIVLYRDNIIVRSAALIIALVMWWCGAPLLRAQSDTLAVVQLRTVLDPRPESALVEFWVVKRSASWQFLATSTLRIDVPQLRTRGGLDSNRHVFAYEPGTSQISPLGAYQVGPRTAYHLQPDIIDGVASVMLTCPDSVDQCMRVLNVGDSLCIGRFRLATRDGSIIPDTLEFVSDQRQLALSYKRTTDSVTVTSIGSHVWYVRHDNVPMGSYVAYRSSEPPVDSCNAVFALRGVYAGNLRVRLGFDVSDEHCYYGYWFERALVDRRDPTTLAFAARPLLAYTQDASLLSCQCLVPQTRDGYLDVVEYRREQYAYRLMGLRRAEYGGDTVAIDTVFINIGLPIISNAVLLENPFPTSTTVQFNVDDRLVLTGEVYDLGGRRIATLRDPDGNDIRDVTYERGQRYRATFDASSIAAQGLVNIVLVGTPVDETAGVEQSRVVLKGQILR